MSAVHSKGIDNNNMVLNERENKKHLPPNQDWNKLVHSVIIYSVRAKQEEAKGYL